MSKITVKLSQRIIKLWIAKAERILKEENKGITFKNILNEINQFDDSWVVMGLSKQDKKDIRRVYLERKLNNEI